jgi:hypothetical protein
MLLLPVSSSGFYEGDPAFYQGEMIDAFSIMDKGIGNPKEMLSMMDEGGVSKTLLASRMIKISDFISKVKPYKKRLIPLFPLINKWFLNHKEAYIDRLGKMSKRFGDMRGSGDLMLLVREPTLITSVFDIKLNDDRVRAVTRAAERNSWPLIIRINIATMPPGQQQHRVTSLNQWLSENSSIDVVLLNLAQLDVATLDPMFKRHPRLHVMLSYANPEFEEPAMTVFTGGEIDPKWRHLMEAYPERFIFALGNFGKLDWNLDQYINQIKWWRSGLTRLNSTTADAIAHGNARRLWKLQ